MAKKTIAIMQPYLFPYLGYFNLIKAVDEFWLLDSVKYIAGGWANRNRILQNGAPVLFTVPVRKGARTDRFDAQLLAAEAPRALDRLQKSLDQAYAKAPFGARPSAIVGQLRTDLAERPDCSLVDLTERALALVLAALDLAVPVRRASELAVDGTAQDRVINLCLAAGASDYVNMIGGAELYDRPSFEQAGLRLHFLKPDLRPYPQIRTPDFVPGLSILDLLAHLDDASLQTQLSAYRLV